MTKTTFIYAAFLLVLASLFTHAIARSFLEESIHRRAARIRQVASSHTTYVADPLATGSRRIRAVTMQTTDIAVNCS